MDCGIDSGSDTEDIEMDEMDNNKVINLIYGLYSKTVIFKGLTLIEFLTDNDLLYLIDFKYVGKKLYTELTKNIRIYRGDLTLLSLYDKLKDNDRVIIIDESKKYWKIKAIYRNRIIKEPDVYSMVEPLEVAQKAIAHGAVWVEISCSVSPLVIPLKIDKFWWNA